MTRKSIRKKLALNKHTLRKVTGGGCLTKGLTTCYPIGGGGGGGVIHTKEWNCTDVNCGTTNCNGGLTPQCDTWTIITGLANCLGCGGGA